jgi:hypothetical protein
MEVVTICNAIVVSTIFVGCVWEIGNLMDLNIMSAQDTKKIPILHMNLSMLRLEKLLRNIFITMKG